MGGVETILIAFFGGLLPSLLWLGFWLMEDRCEPEPKLRLVLTFLSGMAAVGFVLPLEEWVLPYASGLILLFIWAITEECFKLLAATIFGLASSSYDEPIDAIIYMVTAALGFAAAENALFLFNPLAGGHVLQGLLTGDERFIGATLLHTLSSSSIGLAMAFAFYKNARVRRLAIGGGVILAVLLHTVFNFFILQGGNAAIFSVFLSIWAGIVIVLFLVERIKLPARDYC